MADSLMVSIEAVRADIRRFVMTNFLFGDTPAELRDEDSFLDTGIIDSTGVLELVAFLEQQYGVQVSDAELIPENLDSVNQVAGYVRRKLQQ